MRDIRNLTDAQLIPWMKDALQSAYNHGAFFCPLAGREKPAEHEAYCEACRIRAWLTPGWYLRPETEVATECR